MRVLLISNTYPPADISGVGVLVHELARQLADGSHEPHVLTRRPPADDPHASGVGGPKLLFPLAAGWRSLRMHAARPFDLVHVHESDGVFAVLSLRLARWLKRSSTPRLVATLQVSYVRERRSVRPVRADGRIVSRPTASERVFAWLRAPLHALLGRLTARWSDAVVAPSRVTAGEIEEDYDAPVEAVIANGVSWWPDVESDASDTAAEPEDATETPWPVVLYVGRMRTRKAVAVLLEAFAGLLRAYPKARLVLAGDGEHRQALEQRAEALELGSAVHFLGAVPRQQMGHWYGAADIYCLPSIYEGFPVAILEAMAAGLPVVSTTVSGIPEAVEDGVTGLLVEPEDAAALTDALERLAADAELCRDMGQAGQQLVRERFAIDRVCAEYLELWQRLLAPPTR